MSDDWAAFRCDDCGERWFYGRVRCPECGSDRQSTYRLAVGVLEATTTASVTPPDVRDENALGLARFDGDVTVVAQLTDDALEPGDAVRLGGDHSLREGGERAYRGPRLEPAED